MTRDDIRLAVEEAQKPLVARVDKIAGQRTLAMVVAALSLLTAIAAVIYGINREDALKQQINVNQVVVCAQAKSTALAPRGAPLAGESRNHYLNRLEAQREQLLAVGNLECPTLHGFATFPYLRAHAIAEIEAILHKLAPGKLRGIRSPPRHRNPSLATVATSSSPVSPATGDGESRAPAGSPAASHGGGPAPSHHHATTPPNHSPPAGGGGHESEPAPAPAEPKPNAPESPVGGEPPPSSNGKGNGNGGEGSSAEPPGLLDPALETVCEVTHGVQLCTPR